MFLKTSIFFIVITLLFNCSNSAESVIHEDLNSKAILAKDTFVQVLADLAIAENALNINILNVNINKYDSAYKLNPFLQNNISKARYDSTVGTYSRHPKEYREVYEEVLELLNRKKIQ